MSTAEDKPKSKRIKRSTTTAGGGEEQADGEYLGEDNNNAAALSKRLTFLKPLFAKRPWYVGGKVAFARDGKTVYCAGQGGVVVVKNFSTISGVVAKDDDVIAFTLASGPETLATCSRRGLIRIFRQDLTEARTFNSMHTGPVSEMDFDPTGECLATGSADFTVRVFSASGGYATHNFKGHRGIISAVKFHPNEGNLTLATADVTGVVSLWDLRTRKNIWFRNHMSCVPSIAFLNQNTIVSVGRDRILSVWSKDNPDTPLKTVPTFDSMESVVAVDSQHFVTGGASGELKKWKFDSKTNDCIAVESVAGVLSGDGVAQMSIIASNKSGAKDKVLATVSQTECVFTFRSTKKLTDEVLGKNVGFDDEVFDSTFVSSKPNVLALATNSPLVRVYEFNDEGNAVDVKLLAGHSSAVLSIASHPGFLVSGSKDQSARVWDIESYECIGQCEGHTESVGAVATCSKATSSLFLTGSDDCSIRLWTVSLTGRGSESRVECVDQRVAHSKPVLDVCFSPNDEIIATASADKTCRLWGVEPLKKNKFKITGPTVELKGHRRAVNSVRFSTIDRVVCTSSADTTVRVWSIATGACVRTLQGHTSPVTCALFTSNGTSLISSAADGAMKTWDLKTSTCGQTLFGEKEGGHDDRIWSMSLLATETIDDNGNATKEQYLASVGVDGVVALWKDATKEEQRRRQQLTKDEIMNKEDLDRSIREKRFLDAAKLALRLDRPHQLRQILEMIPPNEISQFVEHLLTGAIDSSKVASFLTAVITWNTLSRTSLVAQRTMIACIHLGDKLQKIVGPTAFNKFLKATIPYTERHFARVDRLLKGSYILDRVLESSSVV